MKRLLKKTAAFTAAVLLAAICALPAGRPAYADEQPEEGAEDSLYYLPVFQTSDIHGWLAAESEGEYLYRLACISDKVKDGRGYGSSFRKDFSATRASDPKEINTEFSNDLPICKSPFSKDRS